MSLRRRTALLASTLALSGPLAATSAAFATTSPSTAAAVIAATKLMLAKQTGVHLALMSKSGATKDSVSADFSGKSGVETVTIGAATATIKVTPAYSYISGNASGLTSIMGLSAAQAKKVGTHWISLKAGTSQYTTIASGTTIAAVTNVLPTAKGTTLSTTSIHGSKYYVLTWVVAGTSTTQKTTNTITIAATGTMLPYSETAAASTGTGTTNFSNWGEHRNITAPPASSLITYAAVIA